MMEGGRVDITETTRTVTIRQTDGPSTFHGVKRQKYDIVHSQQTSVLRDLFIRDIYLYIFT